MMNNKGFYLLELMVVAMVVMSILFFLPVRYENECEGKVARFAEMLDNDLKYSLTYTLNTFSLIRLNISSRGNFYTLTSGTQVSVHKRHYDKRLTVKHTVINISHGLVVNNYDIPVTCGINSYRIKISERSGLL